MLVLFRLLFRLVLCVAVLFVTCVVPCVLTGRLRWRWRRRAGRAVAAAPSRRLVPTMVALCRRRRLLALAPQAAGACRAASLQLPLRPALCRRIARSS